jgi:uncharacterized protein
MVRKFLKKQGLHQRVNHLIEKYNIQSSHLFINRKNVAKAVFIGIFIGFIPMPMQILVVVTLVPFVRFNLPLAILLLWFNNPLTMAFIYYIEYRTGSILLRIDTSKAHMSLHWFTTHMHEIFLPLYVGTLVYSTVFASFFYIVTNYLWRRSVLKEKTLRLQQGA